MRRVATVASTELVLAAGSMVILGYKAATGVGLNPPHSRPAANDAGLDIDRCGVFWSFPPPALSERPHGGLAPRSWRAKGRSRRGIPARLEPVINTPRVQPILRLGCNPSTATMTSCCTRHRVARPACALCGGRRRWRLWRPRGRRLRWPRRQHGDAEGEASSRRAHVRLFYPNPHRPRRKAPAS